MKKGLFLKNNVSPLLKLAIPLVLTGLMQSVGWFFITVFLARLGTEMLAAGALASWLNGTIVVIMFGILSSINILVAHKHGANDQKAIALIARDGVLLALLLVIPAFLLFWNMSPIFLLFGQSSSVVALSSAYLHAVAWGLFSEFIMMACFEVIVGIGHTKLVMIFSVFTVLLNILFSYLFIFGKFGFPALGVAGAGWGLTVSNSLMTLILIVYIYWNETYKNYFRYLFKLHMPIYVKELLQVGVPMGAMYCVEVGFFLALTLMAGLIGSEAQAVNQVALQYLGLLMAIMFSIAQAITVRMGHLLGAKEADAAKTAAYVGIGIAFALSSLAAIVFWAMPDLLISVDFNLNDLNNVGIISAIKKVLMVSAVFQIVEATRIAFFGALRGVKDTRFTLLTSILSFWFVAFPLGYLFAIYLQWKSPGFWWGLVISACISVVLLQWRFKVKMKHYSITA